jgi:demethylmenaquinone methyltransferase/2-methoxy-6-polyprenyl-1,4-benzoquinol methylase
MSDEIHNPAFVAALFDRCAARYRRWSTIASLGLVGLWRRQCVDRLRGQAQIARIQGGRVAKHSPRTPQVIDFMSGTGGVWPDILAAYPRATITAVDICAQMHARAVDHMHPKMISHITHVQANALDLDLGASTADMVVSTFGLKTLDPDQQTIMAYRIARVLRGGGCFCLIEASDPKGWVLRSVYRAYLDHAFPLIERVFSHGAQDFSMIGCYTAKFGSCSHMADALRDAGLTVTFKRHFFGCATSVAGTKPIAPDVPAP